MNKWKKVCLGVATGIAVAGINMGAHYLLNKAAFESVLHKKVENSYCRNFDVRQDTVSQYNNMPYLMIGNDSVRMYE